MSVDGDVLGQGIVVGGLGGGTGAGVSMLANTGNPLWVGIGTGLALIVIFGLLARRAQTRA